MDRYPEQAKRIFQAVILICIADGKVAATEIAFLNALRSKHPLFSSLKDPQGLVHETKKELDEKGADTCLEEIAEIVVDKDYRELCFRLCAEMMEADEEAGGEEADALGTLQMLFKFSADDVKRILSGVETDKHQKK